MSQDEVKDRNQAIPLLQDLVWFLLFHYICNILKVRQENDVEAKQV